MKVETVKIVDIKDMPSRVNEAYRVLCESYSDRPLKGTAKEFYTYRTDNPLHASPESSHIDTYDSFVQCCYPIVADWLNEIGIDLRTEIVYILWD